MPDDERNENGPPPDGHDERADEPLLTPELQAGLSAHVNATVKMVLAIQPGHLAALRVELERAERRMMLVDSRQHAQMAGASRKAMQTCDALEEFRKRMVEIVSGPVIVPASGVPIV